MTGTFDDWGATVRLDKKGDVFEKLVDLGQTNKPVYYKVRACVPVHSRGNLQREPFLPLVALLLRRGYVFELPVVDAAICPFTSQRYADGRPLVCC